MNVIYVRQSLGKDKQKLSIDVQISTCLSYAKKRGMVIHKIYNEGTMSARKTEIEERAKLTELLKDVKAGKIKRVIVFKRDRLARKVDQYIEIIETFQQQNVEVCFSADGEPPIFHGAVGQLVESLLGGMAEQEAELIVKRLITSRIDMVQKGNLSSSVPKWYDYDKEKKELSISDVNKEFIRTIYEEFINHPDMNYSEIKKWMKCHPILGERDFELSEIIGKEIHRGRLVQKFNGIPYEYPGILDKCIAVEDDDWIRAVKKMKIIKPELFIENNDQKKVKKEHSILSRILFCKDCLERLSFKTKYCTCEKCGIKIDIKKLENEVCHEALIYLQRCLQNSEKQQELLKQIRMKYLYPLSMEIRNKEIEIKEIKGEIKKGIQTWVTYNTRSADIDTEVHKYQKCMKEIIRLKEKYFQIKTRIDSLSIEGFDIWKTTYFEMEQRKLILKFISKIRVSKRKRGDVNYPHEITFHSFMKKLGELK